MRARHLLLAALLTVGACGEVPVRARRVPTTLRVACLNVWGVPVAAKDLDRRLERLVPALRELAPDVLCLQEVFLGSTRRRILDGLGEGYQATPGAAGGLLIASRLPLRDSRFTAFPVHPSLSVVERLARKGYLEAVVDTPAGPLRVVTAHVAAEWTDGGPRDEQVAILLEALAGRTKEALLFAGDLNTGMVTASGPTETYEALRGLAFVHAEPPLREPGGGWAPATPTRMGWPRGIDRRGWSPDHVLVRGGPCLGAAFVSYTVGLDTPRTAVSDHNLLLSTVRLTPR